MFYKKGIDITKDKEMFNFLKEHFEYYTMNSWNGLCSIANDVKIYRLNLSGNCWNALTFLQSGEYETVNTMIYDWEMEHPNYDVGFNGRSGGYLVLTEKSSNYHVLPEEIYESDTYDDYKEYCKEYYGSVKANRSDLVFYTKLVQDFDKLCDEIRDYCDTLSNYSFEVEKMKKSVEQFNDIYYADLKYLGFKTLKCDKDGIVNISEVLKLQSLTEAFLKIANKPDLGYTIKYIDDFRVKLVN